MITANINSAVFNANSNEMAALSIDWSGFGNTKVDAGYNLIEMSAMSAELSVSHL